MALINTGPLPIQSLNIQVLDALKDPASRQIINDQLNTVLRATLISSAKSRALPALESLLENLRPADFGAEQNLSLRDFVTKYATLPTDPAANKAAQRAIATLSTSTTVGQFSWPEPDYCGKSDFQRIGGPDESGVFDGHIAHVGG